MNDFSSLGPHRPVESVASEARTLGDVLRRRARVTPSRAAHFSKTPDGEVNKLFIEVSNNALFSPGEGRQVSGLPNAELRAPGA